MFRVDLTPGQVVFGDTQLYLKAPAAYWTKLGEPSAAAARHANTWTSLVEPEGETAYPQILDLDLSELTPVHVGGLLQGSGGNDIGSCVRDDGVQDLARQWSPAPPAPAPQGIPANAVRFTKPADKNHCPTGTYWVTPATHQLTGYFGADLPAVIDGGGPGPTGTALIARPGTKAQGTDVYRRVTRAVAALPSRLQVSQQVSGDVTADEEGPAQCLNGACSRLALNVTGGTNSKVLVVTLSITFTLSTDGHQIGRCTVRIANAGPDGTRPAVCTVVNAHAPPGAGLSSGSFDISYDIDPLLISADIDPAQLAAQIGHAPH